jgi:hypothetical protein
MGKNIMLIYPWHPLYEVNKPLDVVELVWFKLPALPLEFLDPGILETLGNLMGNPPFEKGNNRWSVLHQDLCPCKP